MERLDVEFMADDLDAWADLVTRALEPNAFFEPGFAMSMVRHFPVNSRPHFVAVWKREPVAEKRRLLALCPIVAANSFVGINLTRLWLDKQSALATPLLDRTHAVLALKAFFDWLAENRPSAGVIFPKIPRNGPTFDAISVAAMASARRVDILEKYERAVLVPGASADEIWTRGASKKALRELHRRQRRLEEHGPLEIARFTCPGDVRHATENFLVLEASGWKSERGALLAQPSLATFVRSATRLLAREGKCQIHSLAQGGRALAMGIVVESQGRSFFWKMAFDEAFRSQAPGIQLVYELTKAQLTRTDIDMTDSCAIANHPMIDRFWPDRLAICDIAVQLHPDQEDAFVHACRKETFRRRARSLAKDAAVRILKRKVS